MKSLQQHISEKLVINKNYTTPYNYYPTSPDKLRQIILDRYEKKGPGTKGKPIDFNDIYVGGMTSFYDEKEENGLFSNTDFKYIDVSGWDVSNIKNISHLFSYCLEIKELDLFNWDVSNVKDMSSMFYSCKSLEKLDLSNWDVSNVKDMSSMFYSCKSLEKLDISDWNTSNIMYTELVLMFKRCKKEIIPDWYKE